MGFVVDIIILALIALSIFIGYKRGLIKCAINVLSFFIAILVVILLTTPISNLIINNTKIDDNIKATILEKIYPNDAGDAFRSLGKEELKLDENNSNLPEVVRDYVNDLTKGAYNNADVFAENISVMIVNIAVAIVLFIGTKFALIFVKALADIVGKIPLIKQFNKAGGIIYGVASGVVRVYLILAIISIIVPVLANGSIIDAINSSMIGKAMYNNNILLKIIL